MYLAGRLLLPRLLRYILLKPYLRFHAGTPFSQGPKDDAHSNYRAPDSESLQPSLPFDRLQSSEKYGQLMCDEHLTQAIDLFDGQHVKKITFSAEQALYDVSPSPFRNSDGSFAKGKNSEEARLDPRTLDARVDSSAAKLPPEIAKVINKNILLAVAPDKLRERAAQIYQALQKDQIQRAPELGLDSDAHIAALFLQNYSHAYRTLSELKKRVGASFSPDSVLDVGYGPGTGMIALNELMGTDFTPKTKEVYVVGRSNNEMKKRARILLLRQLNEIPEPQTPASVSDVGLLELRESMGEKRKKSAAESDYTGRVDASQIRIRTRLRDALPSTKQYALIIVNQALLSREHSFPRDVDTNLHMVLRLLKPNGHLVIIERGNALGFEIVARARQVMLRPESHLGERGKVPRPYIRGLSIKPQKIRKQDQLITEEHFAHEKVFFREMEKDELYAGLEAEIASKYGELTQDDLKFEFEDTALYVGTASEDVDYHLSVVAPCAHHAVCPLQLGDPKYYKISGHEHRLQFCSFGQAVERPKYTMELKRGKRLATLWNRDAADGFGLDAFLKTTKKLLQGTGRPGGNNSESGNFSYLIVHRADNSAKAIGAIKDARAHNDHDHEQPKDNHAMPRILETPEKVKKNVRLKVCAPSGNIEYWQIPRSTGKQHYHDARKARQGDLWALGKKTSVIKPRMSQENLDKLKRMSNIQRKFVVKEKRKQQLKKFVSRQESDFDDPLDEFDALATELEQSRKYRSKGKRADFDVDWRN